MTKKQSILKRAFGMILAFVLCMTMAAVKTPTEVQAASGLSSYKRVSFYKSQKIGNTTYSMKYNDRYKRYIIYMRRNGKIQAVIKDCSGASFVTNGKVIYYTSGNYYSNGSLPKYKNIRIKQYSVNSRKSKTLNYKSGPALTTAPIECDGSYLYFANCTQYGGAYGNLCVMNLKTRRIVSTGYDVSNIRRLSNGRLLVSATEFPHGGQLYLMNRNGTGKKMISREIEAVSVKGKYIYYTELTYSWSRRKCRCDLNGNNKKALTRWYGGISG